MAANRYKVTGLLHGLSSTTMHRFLKSAEKAADDLTESEIFDTLDGRLVGGTSKLARQLGLDKSRTGTHDSQGNPTSSGLTQRSRIVRLSAP